MGNSISEIELHKLFDGILALIDGHNRSMPRWGIYKVVQVREFVRRLGMERYFAFFENDLGKTFLKLLFLLKTDPNLQVPEYQALLQSRELKDLIDKISKLLSDAELPLRKKVEASSVNAQDRLASDDIFAMLVARSHILNLAAIFHFQKDISQLIRLSRQGDREAMLALVKLDPTFTGADFVRQELLTAELCSDMTFKRKLSIALTGVERGQKFQNKRNRFALTFLSRFGFQDRPDSDWSEFLKKYTGFKSLHNPFNLGRARLRYGLGKRQKPQQS